MFRYNVCDSKKKASAKEARTTNCRNATKWYFQNAIFLCLMKEIFVNKKKDENVYDKLMKQTKDPKKWVKLSQSDIKNISISNQKISQIDANQLQFDELIGNGSFGEVWKGKWRLLPVAIKQIKQEIINEKSKCQTVNLKKKIELLQFCIPKSKSATK